MQLTSIQLLTFTHSLVIKIKTDMELSRNAQAFRAEYKRSRGLQSNAKPIEVLLDVEQLYLENGAVIPSVAHEPLAKYKKLIRA